MGGWLDGWLGGRGDLSVGSMGCGWWTGGYSAEGEYVGGSTSKRRRGGLHPSNGTREPLSNRCRGGARSPRWLLRTLMSFSLASPPRANQPPRSLPPLPPSNCLPSPSTASLPSHLSSSRRPFFVSASPSRHRREDAVLHRTLSYPFLLSPPPFSRRFPLSPATWFSRTPRGGHDTCQSTADARSIPTDLGLLSALLHLFLRPIVDNHPHPPST